MEKKQQVGVKKTTGAGISSDTHSTKSMGVCVTFHVNSLAFRN